MTDILRQLFLLTIRDPAAAAGYLVGQELDRMTGWSILALGVVLNTLVYFLTITLFPVPTEVMLPLMTSPLMVSTVLGAVVVIFVFAFYWVGRVLGGQGAFEDILLMMGWLQFMRLAVQVISLVLMLFLPAVASLFVMAAGLYGIWIVVNFLTVAHRFDGLGKAVMVMVLTMMGLTVGLSIFLSVIGVAAMGIS